MKSLLSAVLVISLAAAMASAQIIVNDSWADGGRNNGVDAQDADWWYSTSSSGIEVGVGNLGLVSGTSGRGIHGTFDAQSLNIGETLTATFTFVTPATVTANGGGGSNFRIGLFDTTGHPGLAADLTASSGSPNPIYNNLNGYMMDFDVNPNPGPANITFRERSVPTSGQLLAATGDYTPISSGGGDSYSFLANTTYTGVFSLTRTGADTLDLSGSLYEGASLLSTWTVTDTSEIVSTIGLLAFHVNSSIFGSSSTPDTADNGIDFTNIKIELTPVPEPSALALSIVALSILGLFRKQKSSQ